MSRIHEAAAWERRQRAKRRRNGRSRRLAGANVLCSDVNYTISNFYSYTGSHESLTVRE
jgi:hypothetical protein